MRASRIALGMLVAAAMLAMAPLARADISFTSLSAKPANTDAGANSNFTLQMNFGGSDSIQQLTVHLPPGQVADPTATPLCTVSQLNNDNCPAATQVGSVSSNVTVNGTIPLTVDGSIYNLTPQTGEPARFGIVLRPAGGLLPKTVLQTAVKLRTSDYGLDSITSNIPNTASGLPLHIDSQTLTLFGSAGNPKQAFSRNPTSCMPATTGFDAIGYGGGSTPPTATGTATYTPTNCSALDFSPTFSASIGSAGHTAPSTHPPLETVVDQDSGEAGVQNVQAILPKGIGADANALTHRCPLTDFQAGSCPKNTIVGSATAASPYLTNPLSGPVSIVEPEAGQTLPRLGLDLQGSLHIQLFGSFVLTANGPGNAFTNIPDIPLSHFVLDFKADDLVATSRDLCKGAAPTFGTSFTGWNGATQSGDVAAKVNGCGGGGGGGGSAKPKAKVAVTNAGSAHPHLKLTVTEKAKGKRAKPTIKATKLTLAKGLAFTGGKATKRGVKIKGGKLVKAKGRTLKAKGKGTKVVEKAVKKSLERTRKLAGKKLRFKLAVKDSTGKTTKLNLATKAKP